MGESIIFHLKSLLLVMHVFLSILYCRSFASGILKVLASFKICLATMLGGRLCSSVNFSSVPQCLGLKDLENIALARSLQPCCWVGWSGGWGQRWEGSFH